jgi:CRP-like cAMP-binding protein
MPASAGTPVNEPLVRSTTMPTELPSALVQMIHALHPLSKELWRALLPLLVRRRLAPREHLAELNRVHTTVGFLERGRIRAYYTTAEGREYNKHLFSAPDLVGDYASLLTQRPVEVPQQALTACVVWLVPYASLLALESRFPELIQLQRRFAESLYLANEQRELELATIGAAERYRALCARSPGLEEDVPLYEIAAYLGITATQLSRIRAQRSRHRSRTPTTRRDTLEK